MLTKALRRLSFLFSYSKKEELHSQQNYFISSDELLKIIDDQKLASTYQLIDLRTPKEVKTTGTINGAIAHDYFDLDIDFFLKNLSKSKNYIVYCKVGGRSGKMAKRMRQLGFKVKDYSEGIDGWLDKKNKTVEYNYK